VKARAEFESSIQEGFFPFIALYLLGYMERQRGSGDAARLYFQESINAAKEYERGSQENPRVKSYRAMALAAMEEADAAITLLQDLEALGEGAGDILNNMARGYALLGDAGKVAELLKRAVTEHAGPTEKEINLDPHFAGFPPFSAESAQ
jgi:Flp pilus assembly protein TadD